MIVWLPLIILSAQAPAPMDHRYAESVFTSDFEPESDVNYDGWPDNWTRRRGQGFPHYVSIRIENDPADKSKQSNCLRIDLDGGGGIAYSPPIEISPLFNYVFQGKVKTEGLTRDVAFFTVSFFDGDNQHTETQTSEKLTHAAQWQELRIGPVTPANPQARWAVIGLHLVPTSRSDLTGTAMFDDLCLARLPNMTIQTAQPHNLFSNPGAPEITCTVSGIQQSDATVFLELLDVSGRTLISEELRLSDRDEFGDKPQWPGEWVSGELAPTADGTGHAGTVAWRPRFPDYGFYRVRASLRSRDSVALTHTVSLAVLRNLGDQREGEFGWSLARDGHTLSDDALITLLNIANATWVKYPIWYGPDDDAAEGERIAELADRLSATGIEMVGVFDRPPLQVYKRFGNKEHLTVAEAFLEPDMWRPAIDPLMIRLSLKIQWWQLGADEDDSFIDYEGLQEKVHEIRAHLKQFGQRTRLGLAWRWMYEAPATDNPPWDFLAMTESPSFTSAELERYAKYQGPQNSNSANSNSGNSSSAKASNWVTLWPLPRNMYDYQTRAQDLVLRMVEAKIDGTKAIFVGNPFDPTRGLLNQDGTPDDLFLPWSITSRMVSGAEYIGSLQLPNGSPNHVFARNGEAVMVVWSKTPVTESLYLGENVTRIDPWGRETVLSSASETNGEPQHVAVGPLPAFVTGLNLAVARWRMDFSFEPNALASTFGRQQTSRYRFQNTFEQGVGGTLELHAPEVWEVNAVPLRFKLGADEDLSQDFQVLLHANASSGPQPVRIDFDVFADKQYRFSVYRKIQVGLGDVLVELDTWLNDDGKLIVEQHLLNQTAKRLDFNCYLFAPGRRRMRMQVFDIGPGRVTHTFALQDGEELLGKSIWLRVEELGGERLQNYHVIAEP